MLVPVEHGAHCTGAIQTLPQICVVIEEACLQGGGRKAGSVMFCDAGPCLTRRSLHWCHPEIITNMCGHRESVYTGWGRKAGSVVFCDVL